MALLLDCQVHAGSKGDLFSCCLKEVLEVAIADAVVFVFGLVWGAVQLCSYKCMFLQCML